MWDSTGEYSDNAHDDSVRLRMEGFQATTEGDQHYHAGKLEAAKQAYERALELAERLPTSDQHRPGILSNILTSLAAILDDLNLWEDAKAVYVRAIALSREIAEFDERAIPLLSRQLNNLGNTLSDLCEWPEALAAYKKSVEHRRQLAEQYAEFRPRLTNTLNLYGEALRRCGKLQEAVEALEEALSLSPPDSHRDREWKEITAKTLKRLGDALADLGELDRGYDCCQQALGLFRELDDKSSQADALQSLGVMEAAFGRYEEALLRASQAVDIRAINAEESGTPCCPSLASALNNQGNFATRLRQQEVAEGAYRKAIEIRERLAKLHPTYVSSYANTLTNFGSMLRVHGRSREAVEVLMKAVQLADVDAPNPHTLMPVLAQALHNLGAAYCEQARCEAGAERLMRAVSIRKRLAKENPSQFESLVARSLAALASAMAARGDLETAKGMYAEASFLQSSESLTEQDPGLAELASTLSNYSEILHRLKDPKAVDKLLCALDIFQQLASKTPDTYAPLVAQSFHNLGTLYADLDKMGDAISTLTKAIELNDQLITGGARESEHDQMLARGELGKVLFYFGREQESLEYLQPAAEALLAHVQDEPEALIESRVSIFQALGKALMAAYYDRHDRAALPESYRWFRLAEESGQTLRHRFLDPRQRRAADDRLSDVRASLILACFEFWSKDPTDTNRLLELMGHSEYGRARALVDALQGEIEPRNTPIELLETLKRVRADARAWAQLLHETDGSGKRTPLLPGQHGFTDGTRGQIVDKAGLELNSNVPHIREQFHAASDEYRNIVNTIRREYDAHFDPDASFSTRSIHDVQNTLDADSMIVHITVARGSAFGVLVTRETMTAVNLPGVREASLRELTRSHANIWADNLNSEERNAVVVQWLAAVGEGVVDPILKAAPASINKLIFIPHRELHQVPFSAVPLADGKRLCDQYEVATAPSLAVYQAKSPSTDERNFTNVLGVLNPDDPLSEDLHFQSVEYARLRHRFPNGVKQYVTASGSLDELSRASKGVDLWHFCDHSEFSRTAPLDSTLGGPSTGIKMRDLFVRLNLRDVRLAILSACTSGVSNVDDYDEQVGFPAAFLQAGAQCVLSSLWAVNDLASMLLMDRFWENLSKGYTISSSLRNAQQWLRGAPDDRGEALTNSDMLLALLESDEFEHAFDSPQARTKCLRKARYSVPKDGSPPFAAPIYWAPFVLSGHSD